MAKTETKRKTAEQLEFEILRLALTRHEVDVVKLAGALREVIDVIGRSVSLVVELVDSSGKRSPRGTNLGMALGMALQDVDAAVDEPAPPIRTIVLES